MTALTPTVPRTARARFGWFLRDGATIAGRAVAHWARSPGRLAFGLSFPVIMVGMFGFLFGGALTVPGGGDYRAYLMPGMFGMTMVFGLGETVSVVVADTARGVTDRFRSMPVSAAASLFGRCAADMLYSALVLLMLVGVGLLIGWQPHGGFFATAAAFGLLLLLRFSLVWTGIFLGLRVAGEQVNTVVQTCEFPLGFLSNAFVATSTMPVFLGVIAQWNPLSATVSAARRLFQNPGVLTDSWVSRNSAPMAVVLPLLIVAVFFPLALRCYRSLSR